MSDARPVFAALAKAQAAMTSALKSSKNPFHKSTYADYTAVVEAVRGPLSANQLCYFHRIEKSVDGLMVTTVLAHESGDYIETDVPMQLQKSDPQSVGSAITYGKRYGLVALTGIPADVDDDGEAATAPTRQSQSSDHGGKKFQELVDRAKSGEMTASDVEALSIPGAAKDYLKAQLKGK